MMKRNRWILNILLLLTLAIAACSPKGATSTPSPGSPTQAPQPTIAPTTVPTEEAPPLTIAPNVRESLNSYRSRIVWQNMVEGGATETLTVEQEETRTPQAMRMLITSEGGEQPGTVEIIQIGNTTWMCSPEGGCIQTQQSAEDAAQTFGEEILFQPEDLLISSDYKYVGRDVVKGIRSRHYTVNPPYDMVNELAYGEVTVVQSDIWVADEPGMPAYVSRLRITWEGTRENKKVTGSWTYELYDVNKPITIQPPASAPAIPKDIPMCAGFTNQTVMGTTILLSCPDSVGTVAEFYRTEMARLGWTAGEESAMGAMVMQEWTKGDRKVSLMIAPGDQGGSSVMVTTE